MLSIDCALLSAASAADAFFWGCWSESQLDLHLEGTQSTGIAVHRRHNWAVVTSSTDHRENRLVEPSRTVEKQAILFRGYLLDPPLSSFSAPERIEAYWDGPLARRHNGIFVSILLGTPKSGLAIVGDAFGVMPLYLREIGDVTLFASAASLLLVKDDHYDPVGLSFSLSAGYTLADRTLIEGVTRLSPAAIYQRLNGRIERKQWYDFGRLADGASEVTDAVLSENQELFAQAVMRVCRVADRPLLVPLTGGYDSRRIVGQLLTAGCDFETATVQTGDTHGLDTDFQWARFLTSSLGIRHQEIAFPDAENWRLLERRRVQLFNCETRGHTWSLPLFDHLRDKRICLLDGLAGDFTGGSIHAWNFQWQHNDHLKTRDSIADHFAPTYITNIYHADFVSSAAELRELIIDYYDALPSAPNTAEIFYLLSQSARSTAPWSFKQSSSERLILCPYLDLDFIEMTYRICPRAKQKYNMQHGCLARYSPLVASFGKPYILPNAATRLEEMIKCNTTLSSREYIRNYHRRSQMTHDNRAPLKLRYAIAARLSVHIPTVANRIDWWLKPLLEFTWWWSQLQPAIRKIQKT
jgi:hypothetical protein